LHPIYAALKNFGMATEVKGAIMRKFHNYIDYRQLTAKRRAEVRKALQEVKQALQADLRAVDQALRNLARKKKAKKR
jgi:hypothetical protein